VPDAPPFALGSRAGLGTAPLGSQPEGPLWWGPQDEATAVDTVRAAVDAGVGWVDTAPFYGWGRAEEIVGRGLDGDRREHVMLLTKCGTVQRADGTWAEDGSPASVRGDLERSLVRLRTDRVDVLQLHDPDPAVPVEETVGAIAALVDEGLVGGIGLSNHDAGLLERAHAVAPIAVVQAQWSLLHHEPEAAGALAWCEAHGVPFLAWSPLASGFLVDDFDLDSLHPDDLRRRLPWAGAAGRAAVAALRAVALDTGRSLRELALGWAARRAHPIVGARTPAEAAAIATVARLEDALAARLESALSANSRQ
jgi:aryl-alcohol dehydrogenase-like predicted oxidoreductase